MSIKQIIDEELAEAGRRIQGRVQSFLLGGGPGRPFLAPGKERLPEGAPAPNSKQKREEMDKRAGLVKQGIEFVRANPGCDSADIMAHLGIAPEDKYLRGWFMQRIGPKVIRKGNAGAAVYYPKGSAQAAEQKKKRGHNEDRFRAPAGPERQKIINNIAQQALAFIRDNPGRASQVVGAQLPGSTVHERYEAYKLLISKGLVRVEANGPMSKLYFPTENKPDK